MSDDGTPDVEVVKQLDYPLPVPSSITCPRCGAVSYNPHDIAAGYCGQCHDWTTLKAT